MTELIKKKWRAMAGSTRLLVLIVIVAAASFGVALMVNAVLYDGDGDGMSDAYEQLFGLNADDASDAALNYDEDTLDNLAESERATDPWTADSDRDGWYDGVDGVPLSRVYVNWGDPRFTIGDDFHYTGPTWWLSAFRVDGQWQTHPPAWHVAASESNGVGRLCIEIDRTLQTNDLMMALALHDHSGASLSVNLLDDNGDVVAADLYGNILSGSDTDASLKFSLPLVANPAAIAVELARSTGEITIYETRLYVDADDDGLDSEQEAQIGTSDQSVDSDTDGLSDPSEANIHLTDPTLIDSDSDGAWDGWEVLSGHNPLASSDRPVIDRTLISAGNNHNLMRLPDGTVLTWGDNGGGRTGQDTTTSFLPVVTRVLSSDGNGVLADVTSVTVGHEYSLALHQAQSLSAWGKNGYGQLGDGTISQQELPVGVHGPDDSGTLSDVIAIAAGLQHTLAIRQDGRVWAWGKNGSGQLGDGTTSGKHYPIPVDDETAQSQLDGALSVAAGYNHSLALCADGRVLAWGANGHGQLGDGSTVNHRTPAPVNSPDGSGILTNIVAISAGNYFSLALAADGSVWAWGWYDSGRLGDGTTVNHELPIRVHGVGDVGFLEDIAAIEAGHNHSLALAADGSVYAWGAGGVGMLGDGATANRKTPIRVLAPDGVAYLSNITAISASDGHSLALSGNYRLYAWGNNGSGRLGDGTTTNRKLPVLVDADLDTLPDPWEMMYFSSFIYTPTNDVDLDGLDNQQEYDLGTNPNALDSDGDTFDDGEEVTEGSDPLDPTSLPVPLQDVSGVVSYTGPQTGTIHIGVTTNSDAWDLVNVALLPEPQAYTLTNVLGETTQWIKAWRDSNADGSNDAWEAWGSFTSNPVYLTNDLSGADIVLVDPDTDDDGVPDWWEHRYFGTLAGQPGDDSDGDGLTDLDEYQRGTNPAKADTDGDGMADGLEAGYGMDPAVSNAFTRLPFVEDFEPDTVTVGDLNGQNRWEVYAAAGGEAPANTATVQTNEVYEGEQALRLDCGTNEEATVRHLFVAGDESVVWVDLYMQAISAPMPTNRTVAAAMTLFDSDARLVVCDGLQPAGSEWVTLTNHPALEQGEWVRLTVKLDYSLQQWLVCLNGKLVADGLGFVSEQATFTSFAAQGQQGFNDRFRVSLTVPDGIDLDEDALLDWWELQHFGTLDQTQDGDYDSDGLTNIEEYQSGTNPTLADSDGDGVSDTIEVLLGSDPNDANAVPQYEKSISGQVEYAGPQSGAIHVLIVPDFSTWDNIIGTQTLAVPGAYSITNAPVLSNVWVNAWRDSNANGSRDFDEASGSYAGGPLYLTNDIANIDIVLSDPDTDSDGLPDWWELSHFGDLGQTGEGDLDSDGLANQDEHQHGTNPADADTDRDGASDLAEIQWNSDPNSSNTLDSVPWSTAFEADEGYASGSVDGQQGWAVLSGSATIDPAAGIDGSQGLLIRTGANGQSAVGRLMVNSSTETIWSHFKLYTAAGALPARIAAGATAVMAVDPDGHWSARDGGVWVESSAGALPEWTHVAVKEDFATRTWDLYLGKDALFSGLAFADTNMFQIAGMTAFFSRFAFFGTSDSPMRLDDITVSLSVPGHIDSDGDGLTTDQELSYQSPTHPGLALDPFSPDTDGDGMSDGQELAWGFDPLAANLFFRIDPESGTNTWSTSFEPAEGYNPGLLGGQNGWTASDGVRVVDTVAHYGIQSVEMVGVETNTQAEELLGNIGAEGRDVVWVSLCAQLAQGRPSLEEVMDSESSAVIYIEDGRLNAFDGILQDWVISEGTFQPYSNNWFRLDIWMDYASKRYMVCINGLLAARDVAFKDAAVSHLSALNIQESEGNTNGPTHVDDITISTLEPAGLDFDGDGLPNTQEYQLGSDVYNADTDGDGLSDYDEVTIHGTSPTSLDSDGDGLPDAWEVANGRDPSDPAEGAADSDGDGLSDGVEYGLGTGINDVDSDDDGLSDGDEVNIHGTDPLVVDTDGDSLSDGDEVNSHGTNPLLADTDSDGYTDSVELAAGANPLDPASNPNGAWAHHLRIHVRDIGLATPLTNVPVLVTLNAERIHYAQTMEAGADLRFSDPTGAPLPYEIQTWEPNGSSLVWVLLPEIPASGNSAHVLMHWGNTNAVDSQDAPAVWSNAYAGVWHLEEDNATLLDVAGGHDATDIGTASIAGYLGQARGFQGADRIVIPPTAADGISDALTLSLWQYGDAIQPQNDCLFEGESPVGREFNVHLPWGDGKVYWDAFGNYDRIYKTAQANAWKGRWNHWTFTRNGGAMAIYLNGALWHSGVGMTRTYTGLSVFNLGSNADGGNNYDGIIDEFRLARTAHSAEWIRAQYLSMTDALLRFGDQTLELSSPTDAIEPHTDGSVTLVRGGTPVDRALTVGVAVGGTATPGSDYVALPATVTIPAGAVQTLLPIQVLDNDQFDDDETVVITLKEGDYLITGAHQATISISDDEEDSDSDGMPDAWEMSTFNTLTNRAAGDADDDGVTNTEEHDAGTNPLSSDTDGDGLPDGWELANGLDPLTANADDDPDGDGLTNAEEYQYGFDPNDGIRDNDQDGLPDVEELHLFGTSPIALDSDGDGTNDLYSTLSLDGTNTSHRNGLWTNSATTLVALDNHYMRAEYTLPVTEAGMYRLALAVTNVHAQAAAGLTFRIQVLIDNIPIGWLETPTLSLQPSSLSPSLTTPWLTTGNHTIRLAWLDDRATGKLLGIKTVTLQRVDGADLDLSGVADWEEWVLDQGYDSDGDGLTDSFELSLQLSPLSFDSDADTLGDGEELNTFGTDPLAVDSDTNGVPDAILLATRKGTETSYRRVVHITSVWKEDGTTLYNPKSGILVSYDFSVTNSGMYQVAFDLRNYKADAPDNYRFNVQIQVNGRSIGIRQIFADLDLTGTGSITTPWLTPGTHTISLVWQNDNDSAGRTTTIAIDEVRLYGFDSPDADGNGVQDWQEAALQAAGDSDGDGISDYIEVTVHGTSPVLKDTDGDGINDNVEISLGLNPTDSDTDGDGVIDWQEINETMTDPLVAEFDGSVTIADQANGADYSRAEGVWRTEGLSAVSDYRRGLVEYQMTCATGDIHRLDIEATHFWKLSCSSGTPVDTSDLLIYIDGVYVGKRELLSADGIPGHVRIFMPWMSAGTHTVRVVWENTSRQLMIKVHKLELQRLGGVDANANGIRDWVEAYLENMTGVDAVNETSIVSPLCLEGDARYVSLTSVSVSHSTNEVPVNPSITGRWYSDVPLAATGTTSIAVAFQNGSLTRTRNVTWTVLNVLEAGNQMIRAGDTLKLTAMPAGATNGVVTIGVGGSNYVTDVSTPLVVEFPEEGDFLVTGTYTDDEQQNTSHQITVSVIAAAFPSNAPACMIGKTRAWACPDIPPQAALRADSTVTLSGTTTNIGVRMNKINRDHYIIARLGQDGPIMARQKLNGFWIQAAVDGYVSVVEEYNTYEIWEQNIVTKILPDDVQIEISIFIGGVTFADDMTTTRWIDAQDLDAIGEYTFQLIHPNSVQASVCHRIKAYTADGLYLGEAYYNQILLPDE